MRIKWSKPGRDVWVGAVDGHSETVQITNVSTPREKLYRLNVLGEQRTYESLAEAKRAAAEKVSEAACVSPFLPRVGPLFPQPTAAEVAAGEEVIRRFRAGGKARHAAASPKPEVLYRVGEKLVVNYAVGPFRREMLVVVEKISPPEYSRSTGFWSDPRYFVREARYGEAKGWLDQIDLYRDPMRLAREAGGKRRHAPAKRKTKARAKPSKRPAAKLTLKQELTFRRLGLLR
jgi:hypothetical protein